MSAHTPTTNAVRRVYALAPVDLQNGGAPNTRPDYAAAQFDRWLAAHDAEVRAETLEGAAKALDETERKYSETANRLNDENSYADASQYFNYASGIRLSAGDVRALAK